MTSIHSAVFVVLIIITGQTLVRGQWEYIETLNAKCDEELIVPQQEGLFNDGYYLKECDPRKYMICKENGGSFTCKCMNGPDPMDPINKCQRPPPTQQYKQFCSHLLTCFAPMECKFLSETSLEPDVCECPDGTPLFDHGELTCRKYKHGEAGCKENGDCATGTCTNGGCICPANTPNWNTQIKPNECQGKYFGEACATDAECHGGKGGLTCVGSKCDCAGSKKNWNDKLKKCDGKKHGEACANSGECGDLFLCENGKCDCAHTTKYEASNDTCIGLPGFGEHCEKEAEAAGKDFPLCAHESLVCDDTKNCKCKYDTQEPDHSKLKCITPNLRQYGEPCSTEKPCLLSSNLICDNGKCNCASGAAYTRGLCRKKTNVRTCNTTVETDFCDDPTGLNEACDTVDNICLCPSNMEWAAWASACKLKKGEDCYHEDQPLHDLCAGQICMDAKDPTLPKKCGCESGEIWSSEQGHGCIENYFMRYCNQLSGPEECRPKDASKYNAAREGLVCRFEKDTNGKDTNVTRCQCKESLTFMEGYCINATMTFGQVGCNRHKGNTCEVGALSSLSCMKAPNGSMTCQCLPKVIPPAYGQSAKVPLSWDEPSTKCELKRNGEKCGKAYECKSHSCDTNGLCMAMNAKKGSGSPLVVAVNGGLMWLMALVPLSLLTH